MNNRKNSVLLYTDDIEILEDLTLEQRGVLLTAILSYQAGAELPEMDCTTKVAFKFMKKQIDANNQAYENACEQRKKAVESRWKKEKDDTDIAQNDRAENAVTKNPENENAKAASKSKEPKRKEAAETKTVKQDAEETEQDGNGDDTSECFRISSYNSVLPRISSYNSVSFRNTKNTDNDKENEKDKENDNDNENENDIDIEKEKEKDIDIDIGVVALSDTKVFKGTAETLCELKPPQLDEIIKSWNKNKCTRDIDKIAPMTIRYDNTRRCVNMYGYSDFLKTLEADSNEWLKSRNDAVTYDWYIKPDNYQKVHDGNYRQKFGRKQKKNGFFNFEQRNDDIYAQLEKVIYD